MADLLLRRHIGICWLYRKVNAIAMLLYHHVRRLVRVMGDLEQTILICQRFRLALDLKMMAFLGAAQT